MSNNILIPWNLGAQTGQDPAFATKEVSANVHIPKVTLVNQSGNALDDGLSIAAGSISALGVIPIGGDVFIDTTGYNSISLQFTSVGSGNSITIEVSDDNVNWSAQRLYSANSSFDSTTSALSFGNASAIDRAFASNVPYLVNVITDVDAAYPRATFGI